MIFLETSMAARTAALAHVRIEKTVLVHLGHPDHGNVDALDALPIE